MIGNPTGIPLYERNLSDTPARNKGRKWYRRNILKILPPVEYHNGVDAAIVAAGLTEIP